MRSYALLLLACLGSALPLRGQVLNFSHAPLPDGKAAKEIYQDRKGYLWISSEGLLRFDGTRFTRYEHQTRDPNSLTADAVRNVMQGRGDTMWVGTMQGISRLDAASGHIANYLPDAKGRGSVNAIYNTVWADPNGLVLTGNLNGLAQYNPQKDCFGAVPLTVPQPDQDGAHITRIVADNRAPGWFWLLRNYSVLHWHRPSGQVQAYYAPNKYLLINLVQDSQGRVWLCSWGGGLGTLNVKSGQMTFYRYEPAGEYGVSNVIFSVAEQPGPKPTYYIAGIGGVSTLILEPDGSWKGRYVLPFQAYDRTDKRRPGSGTKQVLVDRQNIVWVATDMDLSYLPPNNRAFTTTAEPGAGRFYAVEPSSQGGWWLGSWYGPGISKTNEGLDSLLETQLIPSPLSADNRQVSALLEDRQTLWAGTFDGLIAIDLESGKRQLWQAKKGDTLGLPSSRIIAFARRGRRQLWIGTYNNGAGLWDMDKWAMVPLPWPLRKVLKGRRVNILYSDKRGDTWMGMGPELLRVRPDFSFRSYGYQIGRKRALAEGDVTCMAEDSAGALWIASAGGLSRYCPKTDDFDLFTTVDGLSSNNLYSLVTDRTGLLWIGSGHGLNSLDPATGRIRTFSVADGLYADGMMNTMALDRQGKVIIAGDDFLTRFDPGLLKPNPTPPPVYLTAIRLINQPERAIDPEHLPAEGLNLAYDENYLSFDFVALNLLNAGQNRYAYRMEGLDQRWTQAGTERHATYANLPPGTYRFRVRACNPDGVWNEAGASVAITVAPPFWKTWWFIAVCVAVTALALYGLYRLRLRQVLALERIRTDISAGLHDEIGSTLSSISILSGTKAQRREQVTRTMSAINESSRGLMEQMNDIVWSINPRYDSLNSLLQRLRQFAGQVLEARDIDYRFDMPDPMPDLPLPVQVRQNLYLILKEAVNNIAKHSGATDVLVRVRVEGSLLHLEVRDDGCGYDAAVPSPNNGLHNMAARAAAIKALLEVETAPGAGTVLRLQLKWNKYAIARLVPGR